MRIPFNYEPPQSPIFSLVFVDDAVVVLDKPSGLLSVPGRLDIHKDCLETRVQSVFPTARIVHRLDMATSGLLMMPLTAEAHKQLQWQFEARTIEKQYIAVVWGHIKADTGEITEPLITDWPNRPKQMICYERGKSAHTNYEVVNRYTSASGDPLTRVRLFPKTGRTHQLRVHMQFLGHPILGDRLYAHAEALELSNRLLLHAENLSCKHPVTQAPLLFYQQACF